MCRSHYSHIKWVTVVSDLRFVSTFYSYIYRDDSTFTSSGVIKKLRYIDHHFYAFEARDLNLTFSENSAITNL